MLKIFFKKHKERKKVSIWAPFNFTEETSPVCSGPAQTLHTPLQSRAVRAPPLLLQRHCAVNGLLQLQLQVVEARMTPALPYIKTT